MTRNLKAFGLALCAALALCAMAAAGASAHKFKSDATQAGEKTFLTAEQKTDGNTKNIHGGNLAGNQEFQATTADTNKVLKCKKVDAKANFTGPSTETLTATNVKYEECANWETEGEVTKEATALTVDFTECDYVFGSTTTPNPDKPAGKYGEGEHAAVQIKCPVGQEVHIKATHFNLECITLPEQTVHGVKYFNGETEGVEDVSIHATVHGIESTTQNVCGEGVHTDGTYTGEVTVTGFRDPEHTERTSVAVEGAEATL